MGDTCYKMRSKINISLFIFLLLLNNGCSCNAFSKMIPLNEQYYVTGAGNSINMCCVVSKDGKVIIPPIVCAFWGNYPLFYGQALEQKSGSYYFFVLDVDTGALKTGDINSELQKHGLKPFGGYEQISFAEYFSCDSSVDRNRIQRFKENMRIE